MDSAVIPLRHGLSLVQSVDFFYPLVDDPYTMGAIAFANMSSDIYATGVTSLDKITLILSSPTEFTDQQRDIVIPLMIKGFSDAAKSIGNNVRVGNIASNPWCIVGGVATSVCTRDEFILPTGAESGDILVLTKPLGTQLATNVYHWMKDNSDSWKQLMDGGVTEEEVIDTYLAAVKSMAFLNRTAAELMHKHKAHCSTDVTGFGLRGHAQNLLDFQENTQLSFHIHSLPIIKNVHRFATILKRTEKLMTGKAVETSGGLLVCLPSRQSAENYCKDYKTATKMDCWIIGQVSEGSKEVQIKESVKVIDVEYK